MVKNGEGNALIGKPSEAGTKGMLGVPAFAPGTDGGVVTVDFEALLNANTPATTITGICSKKQETVELATLPAGTFDVLKPVSFTLPSEFSTSSWVQLFINTVYSKSTELLVLDNFRVVKTEDPSGVGSIFGGDEGMKVVGGTLYLGASAGSDVVVATLDGRVVASGCGRAIRLDPGIYLVRAGSKTTKIMVTVIASCLKAPAATPIPHQPYAPGSARVLMFPTSLKILRSGQLSTPTATGTDGMNTR